MNDLLPFAFVCLTSFFTLTNPLGTMPVLLSMTQGIDNDERKAIVKRAIIISVLILIGFTICGQVLFSLFGISTNGFRVAAGVIIMKIGYDMLQARYSHVKLKDDEVKVYANDISITPLAIPMLCGPGAIANGIMLMEDAQTWTMKATLIGSIVFIYFLAYVILSASSKLVKILGDTGNNVMMRLMGLILMVIAVECFVAGLKPIMIEVIRAGNGLAPLG
ncbi:MAG: MarC family protein [Paramuribaculum sp.]|nr:MarC family protein [Paramuribaculum sp.]